MRAYCGADCARCPSRGKCRGCRETGGSPFGGRCVAAEYVKVGGPEACRRFRETLPDEINALLTAEGLERVDGLFELVGAQVDLSYPMPSGGKVRLMNGKNVDPLCGSERLLRRGGRRRVHPAVPLRRRRLGAGAGRLQKKTGPANGPGREKSL